MADASPAPLIVVSPHLDDGVFSCGDLLAARPGGSVVTVMAGSPPVPAGTSPDSRGAAYAGETPGEVTPWDRACGFQPGDDVVGARRDEDLAALHILGASPVWLNFCDSQYGQLVTIDELTDALDAEIDPLRPGTVAAPFGLFHSDHILTHEACVRLAWRRPEWDWLFYEDAIYRRFSEEQLTQRREALRLLGAEVRPTVGGGSASALKCRAIACYRSQLRALAIPPHPGCQGAFDPERYWRLRR